QPGETVDFQVSNLTNGNVYTPPWSVTDGGPGDLDGAVDGHIQTGWLVPQDAANSTLKVTATGESSGLTAENTFTGGNYSIAGFVRNDLNGDGLDNDGSVGISGVTVTIYRDTNGNGTLEIGTDAVAATLTTDSSGSWSSGNINVSGSATLTFFAVE